MHAVQPCVVKPRNCSPHHSVVYPRAARGRTPAPGSERRACPTSRLPSSGVEDVMHSLESATTLNLTRISRLRRVHGDRVASA